MSDWLSDVAVPQGWTIQRLKHSIESTQVGIWGDEPGSNDEDILCVRVADFDRPRLRVPETVPTVRSVPRSERKKRLRAGDLLLEKSGGTPVNPVGFVAYFDGVQGEAISSNFIARMRLKKGQHPRYWLYAHAASYSAKLTARSVKQTTGIQNLDQTSYFDERFPFPPIGDQRRIADFLDRETAQIDALIAKQEQLIRGLRERRESICSDTVFGGMRGDTLRNNSEPWLPAMPATWPIAQLGFATDTLAGYAFPSDGFTDNPSDTRLLRGINVKPGLVDWTEVVYWDESLTPVPSRYKLKPGDLVLGMDRPFIGSGVRLASISGDDTPTLLLQRVLRIRPLATSDRGYLRHLFSTRSFYMYLEPMFTGVSVPHVSEWQVRKYRIPLPSISEQREISSYLDQKTSGIDALIAKAEEFIGLARERRAALITDVVTGRIDVSTGKPREEAQAHGGRDAGGSVRGRDR